MQVLLNVAFSAVQSRVLKQIYLRYRANRKHMEILTAIRYMSAIYERPNISLTNLSEILGQNHITKTIMIGRLEYMVKQGWLDKVIGSRSYVYFQFTTAGLGIVEHYEEMFFDYLLKFEKNKYHRHIQYGYLPLLGEDFQPVIPSNILIP